MEVRKGFLAGGDVDLELTVLGHVSVVHGVVHGYVARHLRLGALKLLDDLVHLRGNLLVATAQLVHAHHHLADDGNLLDALKLSVVHRAKELAQEVSRLARVLAAGLGEHAVGEVRHGELGVAAKTALDAVLAEVDVGGQLVGALLVCRRELHGLHLCRLDNLRLSLHGHGRRTREVCEGELGSAGLGGGRGCRGRDGLGRGSRRRLHHHLLRGNGRCRLRRPHQVCQRYLSRIVCHMSLLARQVVRCSPLCPPRGLAAG